MNGKLRPFNVLQAPYIRVMSEVIMPGQTNGKPNIKFEPRYIVSPSAKKISTYIVNQIFGSELVTQTEGLNINWLMPVLKEVLETAIYQEESFIYLHKFDNKVYLECIKKSDIHDLVQKFDKLYSATLIQDFNEVSKDYDYMLKRHITIENGISVLRFEAFEKSKKGTEYVQISIQKFNQKTDNDFLDKYVLPYEVLINIDLGQNFFKDSEKLLNEEMKILNTIAEEIEKTKTRIVTTQHYQSSDIVTSWKPGNSFYDIQTISVNNIADYFTLLPGDKEHQMFEFLQGDVRIEQYVSTFKFYDYQCIQNAGLSPASFGYEKDAYQNVANIDLSKNASDMTIEAIKTQIEPQLNNLFSNIIKLQQSQLMTENLLPDSLVWDYGANEKFDDMKKIQVLRSIQGVTAVPVKTKMKIIMPIIEKLIDKDYVKSNQKEIDEIVNEWTDENKDIEVKFGEV